MAFVIEQRYLDDMIAHAISELPNEACGIIAGVDKRIKKLYRMRNTEESPVRYVIDARQQLNVMREMEAKGWDLLGIFHSHTHSAAYPSQTDVHLAYYSEALYLIVSLKDPMPVVRAFRIVEGKIAEEEIVVKG